MRRITHRSLVQILATVSVFLLVGTSSAANVVGNANKFGEIQDVPAEHWARRAVQLMIKKGFVAGFPDGKFHGKKAISRYEATVILSRMQAAQLAQLSKAEQNIYKRALEELGIVQQQLEIISQAVTKNSETLSKMRMAGHGKSGEVAKELADLKKQVAILSRGHVLMATELNKHKVAHAKNALGRHKVKRPIRTVGQMKDAQFSAKANVPAHLNSPGTSFSLYGSAGHMPFSPGIALEFQLTQKPRLSAQIYSEVALANNISSRFGLNTKLTFGKSDQDFKVYAIIGPGASLSKERHANETALDPFVNVGIGTEYQMASNFNLLADVSAQYFFSNKGQSTGLEAKIDNGMTFAGRLGAKFLF